MAKRQGDSRLAVHIVVGPLAFWSLSIESTKTLIGYEIRDIFYEWLRTAIFSIHLLVMSHTRIQTQHWNIVKFFNLQPYTGSSSARSVRWLRSQTFHWCQRLKSLNLSSNLATTGCSLSHDLFFSSESIYVDYRYSRGKILQEKYYQARSTASCNLRPWPPALTDAWSSGAPPPLRPPRYHLVREHFH